MISTVPTDGGHASALDYITRQNQRVIDGVGWAFAVVPAESERSVGFVGVFWRGLTTRAVRLAADWALEQPGLMRLEAYIEPWNTGSIRVVEGAGFEHEGLMKSFAPVGDRRMDALLYARLAA
ncbi:GNAT family N-acetyltransferase [Aeromicrobium sp. CF3.5]|uniref:GNAT family N-acetyltransferase n=1 Tax=Aeromicrobium sp. CF3.5 TaxID=3373078 RepID=UPI003EE4E371